MTATATSSIAGRALAAQLAEKILSISASHLTPLAVAQAKMCFVDAIGVTLAGRVENATRILLRTPGVATAPGRSLIFGTDIRTSALEAALVNGTASHALDYDDFSGIMGGHHTVPLMAPLVALAEEYAFSGAKVLLAYVAGVEIEIRLARALGFHHYDKGWHPTSTIGTFGAAAAVAHLLGLNLAQTTVALSIAASMAAGIKANFGTMVKPLHAGQCARNGLLAALLAQRGYDANPFALEHSQGFLNVFNGPGTFDVRKLFEDWASPLEIEGASIALKQFPCCGSTHPAITMMLRLVREEKITADDVERMKSCRTVGVFATRIHLTRSLHWKLNSVCSMSPHAHCLVARYGCEISKETPTRNTKSADCWRSSRRGHIQGWQTMHLSSGAPRSLSGSRTGACFLGASTSWLAAAATCR